MKARKEKPVVYVVTNNHFDPMWRRCWERRFEHEGLTYVSYADLEEFYMLDNLAIAAEHPEYRFEAESAIVVRKFLERHPDRKEELRRLVAEGRFRVPGAGDNIIDVNMVHGESIVRNLLYGLLWVENELGQTTRMGTRKDGFGNSAQLPQIFRGCEIRWVPEFSYSPPTAPYWRGLDGSTVYCGSLPHSAFGGSCHKYRPCPSCGGRGCPSCRNRGIEPEPRSPVPAGINEAEARRTGASLAVISSEELLPNPEIIAWAKRQRRSYDVRFAVQEETGELLRDRIDAADSPPRDQIHDGVELNPNNSGCLVTRIRTKQTCRRQEYALLGAETLALMAALRGRPYPRAAFARVWRDLLFTLFHDAVTATHVDPAHEELREFWTRIDGATSRIVDRSISALARPRRDVVSVVNPSGDRATAVVTVATGKRRPALSVEDEKGRREKVVSVRRTGKGTTEISFVARGVPPLSSRSYRIVAGRSDPNRLRPLSEPVIRNRRFRIEADDRGILSVVDRKHGVEILRAAEYRVGELLIEHDEGSPWATLHPDQTRRSLAEYTRLVAAEKGRAFQRLVFEMNAPRGVGFSSTPPRARITVTLLSGIERIDFHTRIDWDEHNHRIRVAMPVPGRGRHVYGIPYGALERRPYEPSFNWTGANGDWPAVDWAGVETRNGSIALLNRGLPSYRIEPGKNRGTLMLLSLLRSPAVPTYLHEPQYYTMTAWDGMRDAGSHEFDYAITAYPKPFSESGVVSDAAVYNGGLLGFSGEVDAPPMPTVDSKNVRLSSLKWAEKGRAIILRLVEFRGKEGTARITVPFQARRISLVNLLERRGTALEIRDGRVRFSVRPWEIATLRIDL